MKITKTQLRQIIKEEAADCYSDYRAGGLTYEEYQDCLKRFADEEDYGYQRRPRKTTNVGASANEDKIAAVQAALAIKPNKFLKSILTQLQNGRGLSGKQKSIVKSIIRKSDPEAAKVFESKTPAKITKRQLRSIIKEEKARLVRENRSRIAVEGELIGELAGLLADLQGIKHELFGLVDPDGKDMGSVYGESLEAKILEVEDWADKLEAHFESMDSENNAEDQFIDAGIRAREMSKGGRA